MFNEKSNVWIGIFKVYTEIMFWILIATSVILCFCGWCEAELIFDDALAFFEGLVYLIGGGFLAFSHLIVNMLIIQFLNNVQIIRENITNKSFANPNFNQRPAPVPSANEWQCPNCGAIQQNYVGTCGCGTVKPY